MHHFKSARIHYLSFMIASVVVIGAPSFGFAQWSAAQQTQNNYLESYENERFGFRLRYPAAMFKPDRPPEGGDGQTFITEDGQAKIVTYAALNVEKLTPQTYRKTLLAEYGGYDLLDYQPQSKTWFVLSGFRGEKIFYEKIMFSCGNRVINVLAISFPKAEKLQYERVVEQLENDFKTGKGIDTANIC